MKIESNNEILSFTEYLLTSGYTVNPASDEIKRRYLIANRGDEFYMIELGALGSDEDGYGIYRIQNPDKRIRVSAVVPIREFDPAIGIQVSG